MKLFDRSDAGNILRSDERRVISLMQSIVPQDDSDFNLEEAILRARENKLAQLCQRCHRNLRLYDQEICADCAYKVKCYQKSARKQWARYLENTYNLTVEEYELMLFRQGGVCAVCGETETAINSTTGELRKLAVDHNHQTGDIRELLCCTCNTLLGFIEKDRQRVKKLEKYLKKHDS